jgi:hypothetical protein
MRAILRRSSTAAGAQRGNATPPASEKAALSTGAAVPGWPPPTLTR